MKDIWNSGNIICRYMCLILTWYRIEANWTCRHKFQQVPLLNIFLLWLTFCRKGCWRARLKPWQPVTWQIHTLWIMFTIQLTGPMNCISPWHFGNGNVRFHLGEGQKLNLKEGQWETYKGYNLQHHSCLLFTQWECCGAGEEKQKERKEKAWQRYWRSVVCLCEEPVAIAFTCVILPSTDAYI